MAVATAAAQPDLVEVAVAAKKTVTIHSAGKKPIRFKKGALHTQLGVPQGQKIPTGKMAAAAAGKNGPLAKRRAKFAQEVLAKGRKTANRGRK